MQRLIHEKNYSNVHQIFEEIENFYTDISEGKQINQGLLPTRSYHKSFEEFQDIFNIYGNGDFNFNFYNGKIEKLKLPKYDKKKIIVAFSGGKDSVAAVLHYMKLGYEIYLFHAAGINRNYNDEKDRAIEIANYLNLPLEIQNVSFSGERNKEWFGNPFRNIFIANMMLNWGIKNNITTKIAFGNYYTSSLEQDVEFNVCAGDSMDMWRAYEKVIKNIIPNFRIYVCLTNYGTTMNYLKTDIKLLELCQSCMSPYRFKEMLHNKNKIKYKIDLLPNRCGSCWKCAVEYIYMVDHNVFEYNEDYYKHCLNILKKTMKKEKNLLGISIDYLWNSYLFYDIIKSKYKDILNFK